MDEVKLALQWITEDPEITDEDKILLSELKIKMLKRQIKYEQNKIKQLK